MSAPNPAPRRFRPAPDRFTDGVFVMLILLMVAELFHLIWLDLI